MAPVKLRVIENENVGLKVDQAQHVNVGMRMEQVRVVNKPNTKNIKYGTSEHWNSQLDFIPAEGEIIVYSDHGSVERDGEMVDVPGIKVGDGNAYCIDLPFVGDDYAQQLLDHVNNTAIHVSSYDRDAWNNKVSISLEGETIQFFEE